MRIVPPFSVMDAAEYTDTADSSTGSSCCSSLPENETSLNEQCCVIDAYEAESCCGGEDPPEMDIACFLHDAAWDDTNNESFSFDPETIFLNDAGYADCNSEVASLDCSADNGSWFLNELDGHGETFLNEVLDQEWMAAAVANLEKLNDTLNADSCVMHLLESDELGQEH
ncbi:hypothetical protein KP509_22G044600 [Ceratopteris richardii]|nr:hypothetical protein KP509_22G044600 [Ceratopteris richardii]